MNELCLKKRTEIDSISMSVWWSMVRPNLIRILANASRSFSRQVGENLPLTLMSQRFGLFSELCWFFVIFYGWKRRKCALTDCVFSNRFVSKVIMMVDICWPRNDQIPKFFGKNINDFLSIPHQQDIDLLNNTKLELLIRSKPQKFQINAKILKIMKTSLPSCSRWWIRSNNV